VIDRQEIMDFAREFGLDPNIVEKDYVLGWLLAGIANHPVMRPDWIFKGGTCLKKCYFETYRFSEDLDFTITNQDHLDQEFLVATFTEIARWVYEQSGVEMPLERLRFDVFENKRGGQAAEGRLGYRGPMRRRGDPARIKLDLSADEILVLDPTEREIHHPYSDKPVSDFAINCYCFEEVFAEKIRALAERERPRDLYDVINLFRRDDLPINHELLLETLEKKCAFKGIDTPKFADLESKPERIELEAEWGNMLAHQLPSLPPFEQFWLEVPRLLEWVYAGTPRIVPPAAPVAPHIDVSWQPPAMAHAWHAPVSLETIRFAAANRLCVDLTYQGTTRLVEPYSLRRTRDGNIILYALKHQTEALRAYRVDRIEGAKTTNTPFIPRYAIELTSIGPISVPPTKRKTGISSFPRPKIRKPSKPRTRRSSFGLTYVIGCTVCGKKFNRKKYDTRLRPHKGKDGFQCPGRFGYFVKTK